MSVLVEILSPSFLLRDALYNALVIGFLCPLVGVYLVLRRMIFLAVALPQVSAAGIAFAFLGYALLYHAHQHGGAAERALALSGSISFTLVALLVLAALEGKSVYSAESRIGATYALATSLTFLFLASDPSGEAQMVNILKGDILAATHESLIVLTITYGLVGLFIVKFSRQLLLISFDRDLAKVFRLPVRAWDTALYLCIGLVIGVGVMSAGPLVIFGFLTLPPLAARAITKHMTTFSLVASLIGGISAFTGFYLSYALDLPLGPAEVTLLGFVLVVTLAVKRGLLAWKTR